MKQKNKALFSVGKLHMDQESETLSVGEITYK